MSVEKGVDISIPYDAAARLAYDDWRAAFSKGAFDETRFQNFKKNYEAITVANVVAKKNARESGESKPTPLMTLNEYGDFSQAEHRAAMDGPKTVSTVSVLEKAMEAANSQSEASVALKEAGDAMSEEEEVSF
jgi:hypothetical protein